MVTLRRYPPEVATAELVRAKVARGGAFSAGLFGSVMEIRKGVGPQERRSPPMLRRPEGV